MNKELKLLKPIALVSSGLLFLAGILLCIFVVTLPIAIPTVILSSYFYNFISKKTFTREQFIEAKNVGVVATMVSYALLFACISILLTASFYDSFAYMLFSYIASFLIILSYIYWRVASLLEEQQFGFLGNSAQELYANQKSATGNQPFDELYFTTKFNDYYVSIDKGFWAKFRNVRSMRKWALWSAAFVFLIQGPLFLAFYISQAGIPLYVFYYLMLIMNGLMFRYLLREKPTDKNFDAVKIAGIVYILMSLLNFTVCAFEFLYMPGTSVVFLALGSLVCLVIGVIFGRFLWLKYYDILQARKALLNVKP